MPSAAPLCIPDNQLPPRHPVPPGSILRHPVPRAPSSGTLCLGLHPSAPSASGSILRHPVPPGFILRHPVPRAPSSGKLCLGLRPSAPSASGLHPSVPSASGSILRHPVPRAPSFGTQFLGLHPPAPSASGSILRHTAPEPRMGSTSPLVARRTEALMRSSWHASRSTAPHAFPRRHVKDEHAKDAAQLRRAFRRACHRTWRRTWASGPGRRAPSSARHHRRRRRLRASRA